MGQAHSRFERPSAFFHRRKSKAAARETSPESFMQTSPPPPEPDHSSVQMDRSSTQANRSSTTANTTPASAAPYPYMGDAEMGDITMAETSDNKADELDKADKQTSIPPDQPMADSPNQPTQPAEKPTPGRPALKRKFTPPHRIGIWNKRAWETERAYGNVHEHVTKTLNEIREQQMESNRKGAAARTMEKDIYKAADSCTLALEYLVGHFSTMFFHYTGPENIFGMMATIEADATAMDDLRQKQLHLSNYGYSLEIKIVETEADIRELAELARRIREEGTGEEEEEEEEYEEEEGEEADADGDTDPEADAKGGGKSS